MKRITPDGLFISLIILSFIFHRVIPINRLIPYPWNLTGIIFILTGLFLTVISNITLLKHKTSVKPFETPRTLITTGPFRLSRNPIYLGMALALSGVEITLGTISSLILPVIFIIIINTSIIPREESKLRTAFGDKFLAYKSKTRRWV